MAQADINRHVPSINVTKFEKKAYATLIQF